MLDRIRTAPQVGWVLFAFLVAYFIFFLRSVFFSGPHMDTLGAFIPRMPYIGADQVWLLNWIRDLLAEGLFSYTGTIWYPPLTSLVFAPFALLDNAAAYRLLSAVTLLVFGWSAFVFPGVVARESGVPPAALVIGAAGFVAYPLLFELERGQFNMIAAGLAFAGILLAYTERPHRVLPFVLLCVAAQLKVYPAIFSLMLVREWRDWKGALRILGLFAGASLALLMVLGPRMFLNFRDGMKSSTGFDQGVKYFNHSIHSFASLVARSVRARGYPWQELHTSLLVYALIAIVGLCLLLIIIQAYRSGLRGMNPHLLMACALAAITIPKLSYDYTLPILAGPAALFLVHLAKQVRQGRTSLQLVLILLIFSTSYGATLFPSDYKPGFILLKNALPALMMMLLVTTFSAWRHPGNAGAPESPAPT
jgi:hypothetical protein